MTTTVWEFDDLWEEGYRFDEIISKRYCFVPEKCKNPYWAKEYLIKNYKDIEKFQGTSEPLETYEYLDNNSVIIMEK